MKEAILIVGGRKSTGYNELGHLASEIVSYLPMKRCCYSVYSDRKSFIERDIHSVIYTEDGERLQEIIDLCQEKGFNLLNLATGVLDKVSFPENINFVFLDAEKLIDHSIAETSLLAINAMKKMEKGKYHIDDLIRDKIL